MHEPISDVPNTSVRMCIFPNSANVAAIAVTVEIKIESSEKTIGCGRLKISSNIVRTTSIETVVIIEISFVALEELL